MTGANLDMKDDVVIAHTIRNGRLDCIHYGSVVVVNHSGKVLFSAGNFEKRVYERSLTKPYKAVRLVDCGAADKFSFGSAELALAAGSHSGSQMHVRKLQDMLGTVGLSVSVLSCGAEIPLGADAIKELIEKDGSLLSPLHCDCSGEHIGILAICQYLGWPIENYHDPEHPVQKDLRKFIDSFIEYSTNDYSTDGCGLPTYYVPLVNLAKGMANLCSYRMYPRAARRVIDAIIQEPVYFAGSKDRFVTALICASGGGIIGKDGAEGLYALGWPDQGIGLAIKVADGNHRAAMPVIASIIDQLELVPKALLSVIQERTAQDIYTNSGLKVGQVMSLV